MYAMHSVTMPLIGRDAELGVLRAVVSRALEGQAQVVALSGPAGVGKSRLAEECLTFARNSGLLVLRGAGGTLQRDLAYAPLVEALRPLVRGGSTLVDGLPDLGQLFGELSLPTGPAPAPAGLERTRLFESVCRLLERASAREPVALLLDDVHWADRGSLALLHYLVRGLDDHPLLVVLTYRDDEVDAALDELVAGLRRTGMLTEMSLAGLTDQAVGGLVGNLLSGEAPEGLLEMLTARAGGLPLFVGSLVGSFIESGALRRCGAAWTLGPQRPETVPAAVSALLRSRIERLSTVAREVLDLLAVCGAQADHGLLERLLSSEHLLPGLVELRASGVVLEEVVDDRVRYRPTHPLICEVAYELLPLVSRRRRHAEVYRAVREHTPQLWGVLAQHVRRAGDEIDRCHALDVLLAATAHELERGAATRPSRTSAPPSTSPRPSTGRGSWTTCTTGSRRRTSWPVTGSRPCPPGSPRQLACATASIAPSDSTGPPVSSGRPDAPRSAAATWPRPPPD
jgi:predicted ATPase